MSEVKLAVLGLFVMVGEVGKMVEVKLGDRGGSEEGRGRGERGGREDGGGRDE